eukprot:TRINITY_DN677_c1_g1_i5.p1 TRINITY_DN677_c1_g1~~TRINITY_DN677_c1_g1_i5.p1  ORF type:complete len:202 (-),score=70.83 TRINITY_DN677_c1_g1_i5:118-723(-)
MVSDEQDVQDGIDKTTKAFGTVDTLVANAGVQHISKIVDLDYKDWQRVLAINLDGCFLTARAVMRGIINDDNCDGGSIIFTGSVHSKLASPLKAPYVAGKHGLAGLTRVIAKEGAADNIKSNLICPGYVWTPLVQGQIEAQSINLGITEEEVVKDVFLKDTVDGEFTTTEDVAEVAAFLAGFKTKALTGQSMIVSHGWFME